MEQTKHNNPLRENGNPGINTRSLIYGSLMMALVFVATFSIRIPIPFTQGYIHPGDSMIFIASILFGWRVGAVTGGFGSALADLLGGYAHWAFPTLVIKAVMGAIVGWIGHDLFRTNNSGRIKLFLAVGTGSLWLAFCLGIRILINNALSSSPSFLLEQITEAGSLAELSSLVQGVDLWLTVSAIALPVAMVFLAFPLQKLHQQLFGPLQLLGMLVAGLWMVTGYYIAAGFLYGSFIIPVFSLPGNLVQFLGGLVIAYFVLLALEKAGIPKRL